MLGLASSVRVMEPLRAPVAVGLKVTESVQLELAATAPPQLSVTAKSPLATMLAMLRVAPPVLVSEMVCAGLVVPTP